MDDAIADDRELVQRAQRDRDVDAFEALYRRYVGRIHAFAYRRCGSSTVADDITSSTFEAALRGLRSFRWRGGGFAAWLFTIASNELADHFRAEERTRSAAADPRLRDDDRTDAVDEAVLAGADATEVRAALARLNPRYQRAISLRYLSGLSSAEAAEAMGVARSVLAVILHRALGALSRELGR